MKEDLREISNILFFIFYPFPFISKGVSSVAARVLNLREKVPEILHEELGVALATEFLRPYDAKLDSSIYFLFEYIFFGYSSVHSCPFLFSLDAMHILCFEIRIVI